MTRFIARRLVMLPVALLLVNFLGFTYAHYARPLRAARTPYVRAEPAGALLPAYTDYVRSLVARDFSMQLNTPGSRGASLLTLGKTLAGASLASLGLLGLALLLSTALGMILGLLAVQHDPPRVARWLTLISTTGLAMPSFYIGSLFIVGSIFFVLRTGPGVEMPLPIDGFGWDAHLVFPTLALMARPTVQVAQVVAGLLTGELDKQYVVAGRSFGHTWRSIRNRYALMNIIAPVILTFAGMLRLVVGELVLVEWLFKWPGLGRLLAWTLVPAQLSSSAGSPLFLNPQLMAAVLTLIAALFLLVDFTSAVLVRKLDPRLMKVESELGNV